jgi:hypothetical protein
MYFRLKALDGTAMLVSLGLAGAKAKCFEKRGELGSLEAADSSVGC